MPLLEYEVIRGHIDILVVAVRRLSRRWKAKTLLAGPSPTSPMKAKITISPISNSRNTLFPDFGTRALRNALYLVRAISLQRVCELSRLLLGKY